MQALRGITWLLVLQTAGELLARGLRLPLPGPVLGMLLLMLALHAPAVAASVGAVAEFLLAHLSLLFVPVGVGVMTHLDIFSRYGLRIAVVIVLSTVLGLASTALTLQWLMRHASVDTPPDPYDPALAPHGRTKDTP